jgi:hypothetical protein
MTNRIARPRLRLAFGLTLAAALETAAGAQDVVPGGRGEPVRYNVSPLEVHGPYLVRPSDLLNHSGSSVSPGRSVVGGDDFRGTLAGAGCPDERCPHLTSGEGDLFRTPGLKARPFDVDAIGAGDPQIAASKTHLVVTAYNQIAFYTKDGSLVKTDANGKAISNPITAQELFKPLWDPANPKNINTYLNLPAATRCDATDSDATANRTYCLDDYYDARVIFDEFRQRFWIVAAARNKATRSFSYKADGTTVVDDQPAIFAARRTKALIAVSLSGDPRDGFYLYWVNSVIDDGVCNDPTVDKCDGTDNLPGDGSDYPSIGITPEYLIQSNAVLRRDPDATTYDSNGKAVNDWKPRYALVNVWTADGLANGTASSSWSYYMVKHDGQDVTGIMQPALRHGSLLFDLGVLAGQDCHAAGCSSDLLLWTFSPQDGLVAPPLHQLAVGIKPFNGPGNPPQPTAPGVTNPKPILLANMGNTVTKAVTRGQLFLTLQDCVTWEQGQSPCSTSVRLASLDPALAYLTDSATIIFLDRSFGLRNNFDDGPNDVVYYGNPALEVNKDGDIVAVYSRAGSTVYPEARYSAWLHAEDDIRPSAVLHAGTFTYLGNFDPTKDNVDGNGNPAAVGNLDTGGITVDPFDDTAVWMAHAYAYQPDPSKPTGSYKLAVGKVFGRTHPDLSFAGFAPEAPPAPPGGSFKLDLTVANHGDGDAPSAQVRVYLSDDAVISPSDVKLADFPLGAISAGGGAGAVLDLTLPPATKPGKHHLLGIVDPTNAVFEYDETNNQAAHPLNVTGAVAKNGGVKVK